MIRVLDIDETEKKDLLEKYKRDLDDNKNRIYQSRQKGNWRNSHFSQHCFYPTLFFYPLSEPVVPGFLFWYAGDLTYQ